LSHRIPIKQAEGFAVANDLQQVIIFGHDATGVTHVLTWGDTAERAAAAAAGANRIKKDWGWPEDTLAESAKVTALRAELAAAQARIQELEASDVEPAVQRAVHVIEGTEYERGWGQRPDGYAAFLTKADAEAYIASYDKRFNSEPVVPDEYTKYSYIGILECSEAFFQAAKCASNQAGKHFQYRTELTK